VLLEHPKARFYRACICWMGLEHRVRWRLKRGILEGLLSPSSTILFVETVILDRWLGNWRCNKRLTILAYFIFFSLIFTLLLITQEIGRRRAACSVWQVADSRFCFITNFFPHLVRSPKYIQRQVAQNGLQASPTGLWDLITSAIILSTTNVLSIELRSTKSAGIITSSTSSLTANENFPSAAIFSVVGQLITTR
jgi:hypothetical protein